MLFMVLFLEKVGLEVNDLIEGVGEEDQVNRSDGYCVVVEDGFEFDAELAVGAAVLDLRGGGGGGGGCLGFEDRESLGADMLVLDGLARVGRYSVVDGRAFDISLIADCRVLT